MPPQWIIRSSGTLQMQLKRKCVSDNNLLKITLSIAYLLIDVHYTDQRSFGRRWIKQWDSSRKELLITENVFSPEIAQRFVMISWFKYPKRRENSFNLRNMFYDVIKQGITLPWYVQFVSMLSARNWVRLCLLPVDLYLNLVDWLHWEESFMIIRENQLLKLNSDDNTFTCGVFLISCNKMETTELWIHTTSIISSLNYNVEYHYTICGKSITRIIGRS